MRRSYLDYAMSVIVSRALPDVRDGLKPVHRRILYGMNEGGFGSSGQHQEVRARGRRRHGQLSPARRPVDLRRPGAHGAGFLHAPAADRRAGQFRLDGRRSAGGHALHRGPAGQGGGGAARRYRQGDGRFPAELRRQVQGADGPAGALPEPAGQRRRRHRGRHGDQHPDPQSGGSDRRLRRLSRQSGDHHRPADRACAGAGFPDRRHHHGPQRHPRGLSHRPRLDRHARPHPYRGDAQGPRGDHRHRDAVSGEQVAHDRAHRRSGAARRSSRASPTCATRATATACASSSS